jgi:hypothetical protein
MKQLFFMLPFIFLTNSFLEAKADSLFYTDEIINIELRCDFSAIQNDRVKNPQFHDGYLIYLSKSGETTRLSVKLMARGDFRRNPENCSFPPLTVNFKKSEVKNTLFKNQDKLKLVTPCQDDEDVIEEYLIYKMYNKITDLSFKVRLVNINYFDTGRGKKLFEKYSFFIEDDKHLEKRTNSVEIKELRNPFNIDNEIYKKMSVFQYMIGNKDWYVTSKKNVLILRPEDKSMLPFPVPYDFDFSGLVNANYTKPPDEPDAVLAPRRVYKGICYTDAEFKDVFEFYQKLRPALESVISETGVISKLSKRSALSYINEFYEIIGNPRLFKKEFLDVCETRKVYNLSDE